MIKPKYIIVQFALFYVYLKMLDNEWLCPTRVPN